MTEECLAFLEAKWSREFGGQEVCELIEEVRRLRDLCCTDEDHCVAVNGEAFCATHGRGENGRVGG